MGVLDKYRRKTTAGILDKYRISPTAPKFTGKAPAEGEPKFVSAPEPSFFGKVKQKLGRAIGDFKHTGSIKSPFRTPEQEVAEAANIVQATKKANIPLKKTVEEISKGPVRTAIEGYQAGKPTVERGLIGAKILKGEDPKKHAKKLQEIEVAQQLHQKVPEEIKKFRGGTIADIPATRAIRGMTESTAELLPFMKATAVERLKFGVPGGLAAAAPAIFTGQPKIAAVRFGKGFSVASKIGTIKKTAEIEGGNAYLDFINEGVAPERAKPIAIAVGIVNGLIEESIQSKLLKGLTPTQKLKTVMKNPVAKKALAEILKSVAKDYGEEIIQEVQQEIVSITGESLAKGELPDIKATAERLREVGVESAKGLALLQAPTAVAQARGGVKVPAGVLEAAERQAEAAVGEKGEVGKDREEPGEVKKPEEKTGTPDLSQGEVVEGKEVKEEGQVEEGESVGILDSESPIKAKPGDIISAVELDDGRIIFDKNAKIHADVINSMEDNLKIPADQVKDGGFITEEGKYVSGAADAARLGEIAKAKKRVRERIALDKAKEQPQAQEIKDPSEIPGDLFLEEQDDEAEWEAAEQELERSIEKTSEEKLTKENAEIMLELEKMKETPELDLFKAIRQLGGIKKFAFGKEVSEQKQIPSTLLNKNTSNTLDTVVEGLKQYGWNFENSDDLLQHIKLRDFMGIEKISSVKKQDLRNIIRLFAKNKREGEKVVSRINNLLKRPLAAGKVKGVVRKFTGQAKQEAPTIQEREALKIKVKAEERAAREAAQKANKQARELLKTIDKIKKLPIEGMNFEEKLAIQKFKSELKTIRSRKGLSSLVSNLQKIRSLWEKVEALKEQGKAKYIETKESKDQKHNLTKDILLDTIGEAKDAPDRIVKELDIKKKKGSAGRFLRAVTLRVSRLLDKLDGGQNFRGPFHKIFYDQVNKAVDSELVNVSVRREKMFEKIKSLGFKLKDFNKKRNVDGTVLTVDEMISIYTAQKNETKKKAIEFGNNLDEAFQQKVIAQMTDQEKKVGDLIISEYEENWGRVRKAFIEFTDGKQDLGRVQGYTPLRRTLGGFEPLEQELAKELLERTNLKKGFAERGFTKDRQMLGKNQLPIRMGELGIWIEQMQKQEHFITHGSLIKELQRLLADKSISAAIISNKKFGKETFEALEHYVNRVANPNIYKAFGQIDKAWAGIRRNVAIAYLSYNMVTMAKQFPSIALGLIEAGPIGIMSAMSELTVNYRKTINLIHRLAPQMKDRSIDRALEELKISNAEGFDRIIKAVGQEGMRGIYMIDKFVTSSVWKAVFDRETRRGESEQVAADLATKAVLRTQPAAHAKDIADIYATNEGLNWLTQFSNQINNIYNMATYDIPMKFRTGRYGDALRGTVGIGLSALMIQMMSRGRVPDDDEWDEFAIQSSVNLIPIVGPIIVSMMNGFYSTSLPALAPLGEVGKLGTNLYKGKHKKAAMSLLKAISLFKGVPMSQPVRSFKGAVDLYTGETDDYRRLIWSDWSLSKRIGRKGKKQEKKKSKFATGGKFSGKAKSKFATKSKFSGKAKK